jgi:hypothetical protein
MDGLVYTISQEQEQQDMDGLVYTISPRTRHGWTSLHNLSQEQEQQDMDGLVYTISPILQFYKITFKHAKRKANVSLHIQI